MIISCQFCVYRINLDATPVYRAAQLMSAHISAYHCRNWEAEE